MPRGRLSQWGQGFVPDPNPEARRRHTKPDEQANLKRDLENQAIQRALYVKTEVAIGANSMTRPQAFCLGMVFQYLVEAGPESAFAKLLVDLITGKVVD